MSDIRIPGHVIDGDYRDLGGPAAEFLRELNLQSPETDAVDSFNLIKSNALDLTKWTASILAGAGISLAGVGAWFASNAREPLKVVIAGGPAVFLSVIAIVAAWVVTSDVRARATTQEARISARQQVVHDYLQLVERSQAGAVPSLAAVIAEAEYDAAVPRR
jgi:hypothetical protein